VYQHGTANPDSIEDDRSYFNYTPEQYNQYQKELQLQEQEEQLKLEQSQLE
jgi:hypothetical protein